MEIFFLEVIDLTHDRDEKDDLQRAIALSLRETTGQSTTIGVSTEEQDISRSVIRRLSHEATWLPFVKAFVAWRAAIQNDRPYALTILVEKR